MTAFNIKMWSFPQIPCIKRSTSPTLAASKSAFHFTLFHSNKVLPLEIEIVRHSCCSCCTQSSAVVWLVSPGGKRWDQLTQNHSTPLVTSTDVAQNHWLKRNMICAHSWLQNCFHTLFTRSRSYGTARMQQNARLTTSNRIKITYANPFTPETRRTQGWLGGWFGELVLQINTNRTERNGKWVNKNNKTTEPRTRISSCIWPIAYISTFSLR